MANKSFTASERRGILIIAILALIITGAGLLLHNGGKEEIRDSIEIQEMVNSIDTTNYQKKNLEKSKKKRKKSSKGNKDKSKKTYRRRSPVDETV